MLIISTRYPETKNNAVVGMALRLTFNQIKTFFKWQIAENYYKVTYASEKGFYTSGT